MLTSNHSFLFSNSLGTICPKFWAKPLLKNAKVPLKNPLLTTGNYTTKTGRNNRAVVFTTLQIKRELDILFGPKSVRYNGVSIVTLREPIVFFVNILPFFFFLVFIPMFTVV